MNLSPALRQRFFDANGLPLAGGQLFSYVAGTTTPQATYSNSTGTANANPVVLDANGYADVWLDTSLVYKFVLEDSLGNVIWTVDNVQASAQGVTKWNANTTYSSGDIVEDTSGNGLFYVSLIGNNLGHALTDVSSWRLFQGTIRTLSTNTTLALSDDIVRSNSTAGNLTHTLPPVSTTPIGKRISIKDIGTGGFNTSVKGSGTDNIDGANTYVDTIAANAAVTFTNNGTSWDVTHGYLSDGSISGAKLQSGTVTYNKLTGLLTPSVQTFAPGATSYNPTYQFQVSAANATIGATYTVGGVTYTVTATISAGSVLKATGASAPAASGTLTKSGGTGDATIAYTSVAAPIYLRVRAIGGGGGGSSASTGATSASAGGNTTWGSLLTANGGGGATITGGNLDGLGGTGGTATVTAPAMGVALSGGTGQSTAAVAGGAGGQGGTNAMGGGGGGGLGRSGSAGTQGVDGCGAGGGGGGGNGGNAGGAGGGAGGYIEALIFSPATTTIAVGGGGAAGGTGLAGAGAAGGKGAIQVWEYYQ